ncbi:hypothetical protein HPB50_011860 [Hyalomma asiaticum]|uniref:Uncharacterized protein n=1 Tax=Hyalomma asiaticum TaxID=266040 RepID=A0ACB7TLA4_HYAAI|nr:hypothetical protein HPB50_011860 [Hyalomma asiaticum]
MECRRTSDRSWLLVSALDILACSSLINGETSARLLLEGVLSRNFVVEYDREASRAVCVSSQQFVRSEGSVWVCGALAAYSSDHGASAWTVRNPQLLTADVVRFPVEPGQAGTKREATVSTSVTVSPAGSGGRTFMSGGGLTSQARAPFSPAIVPTDGLTGATYRASYDLGLPGLRSRPWHVGGSLGPFRPSRYPPRYPDFPSTSTYIADKIESYLRRPTCPGPRCAPRRKGFPPYWNRRLPPPYSRRGYYYPPPARRYPFPPPHYFAYEDHLASSSNHDKTTLSPYHNYGKRYQKRYYAYYYPTGSKYAYVPLPPYND